MDKLYFTAFDYWYILVLLVDIPQHARHIICLFGYLTIFNQYIDDGVSGQSKIIVEGVQ